MDAHAIRSLAAKVYDKDGHTEADLAFLRAIREANEANSAALLSANIEFGGGSEAWQAVKNLANRQMEADYARALAVYEAGDEFEFAEAAE